MRIAGGAAADAADWRDVAGAGRPAVRRRRPEAVASTASGGPTSRPTWTPRSGSATTVELTTNFRTTAPILAWVNAVFGSADPARRRARSRRTSRCDEHRAGSRRRARRVLALGADAHPDEPSTADEVREPGGRGRRGVVRTALAEKWQVEDERTEQWRDVALGRHRHPRAGAHLAAPAGGRPGRRGHPLPGRGELAGLPDAGGPRPAHRPPVPSTTPATSSRWSRRCARRCSAAATTTCGPGSAAGGSSPPARDRCRRRPGRPPGRPGARATCAAAAASAVAGAERAADRLVARPPDARGRRSAVLGQRDVWRRLRFVVDQARAWSEAEHGGLRGYLAWARAAGRARPRRVAEAVLPETDADAVRIMTIHARQGPGVPDGDRLRPDHPGRRTPRRACTCSGPATAGTRSSSAAAPRPRTSTRPGRSTSRWATHERLRLLYVAATRARDHLVVSLHRKGSGRVHGRRVAGGRRSGRTVARSC